MQLVVDANILFAALIKKSVTSDLLVDNSLDLVTVEFIFEEFEKYKEEIKNKTHRSEEEFWKFMSIVKSKIKVLSYEYFKDIMEEAEKISPDSKDCDYFALALKLNCGIWSNDKLLKQQDKVKVYSTGDLVEMLYR